MSRESRQQQPKWVIEHIFERPIGHETWVEAKAFSPAPRHGGAPLPLLPAGDLYPPDNSRSAALPVFFEAQLQRFERRFGVVYTWLGSLGSLETASDGVIAFRGKAAAIVRGPTSGDPRCELLPNAGLRQ